MLFAGSELFCYGLVPKYKFLAFFKDKTMSVLIKSNRLHVSISLKGLSGALFFLLFPFLSLTTFSLRALF